jgi:hypothetical protein
MKSKTTDDTPFLPEAEITASDVPPGVDRRAFMMRSALFGATAVLTGCAPSKPETAEPPPAAAWLPMTGVAFILYTFYMITDPATTPGSTRNQIAFGAGVAFVYGVLLVSHVVFGLFFALSIVCALRGLGLWTMSVAADRKPAEAPLEVTTVAGSSKL